MKSMMALAFALFASAFVAFAYTTVNDMGDVDYTNGNTNFWDAASHTGTVVVAVTKAYAALETRPYAPVASAGLSGFDARIFSSAVGEIAGAGTGNKGGLMIIAR